MTLLPVVLNYGVNIHHIYLNDIQCTFLLLVFFCDRKTNVVWLCSHHKVEENAFVYGKLISCISSNIVLCFVFLPLISADSRDWQRCGEGVRRNDKCDSDQRRHWHIMSGLIVNVSQFMFNMTCVVVPSSRISPYFWKVSDATVMWTPGINIWSVSGYVILQSYTCSLVSPHRVIRSQWQEKGHVIAMTAKAVCRLHIMTFLTRLMLLILYDGNQS